METAQRKTAIEDGLYRRELLEEIMRIIETTRKKAGDPPADAYQTETVNAVSRGIQMIQLAEQFARKPADKFLVEFNGGFPTQAVKQDSKPTRIPESMTPEQFVVVPGGTPIQWVTLRSTDPDKPDDPADEHLRTAAFVLGNIYVSAGIGGGADEVMQFYYDDVVESANTKGETPLPLALLRNGHAYVAVSWLKTIVDPDGARYLSWLESMLATHFGMGIGPDNGY